MCPVQLKQIGGLKLKIGCITLRSKVSWSEFSLLFYPSPSCPPISFLPSLFYQPSSTPISHSFLLTFLPLHLPLFLYSLLHFTHVLHRFCTSFSPVFPSYSPFFPLCDPVSLLLSFPPTFTFHLSLLLSSLQLTPTSSSCFSSPPSAVHLPPPLYILLHLLQVC